MLFYILLLGAAPILGVFCILYIVVYLCSILEQFSEIAIERRKW